MSDKNLMVYVRVEPELLGMIDDFRRTYDVIPNRSEAIRDLLKFALTAKGFTAPAPD